MSNIDKRALREAAEKAISEEGETWWSEEQLASDYGLALHKADAKFIAAANPATVLALLDELEAAEKRNTELSHHLQCAHAFIEHTEAFGHEASNGILCCGDAQWNIDASKLALAAAGKGE